MLGLFRPREVKDFKAVCAKVFSYIKKKEFDKAIALYMDVHQAFEALPEEYKKKFEKDVNLVFRELTLYMRINEAYVLAKTGSMAAFRRELDGIHDLTFELQPDAGHRDVSVLLDFAKENYEFFLDVYNYKVNAGEFKKKAQHIRALINKKDLHRALKEYAQLLIIYNKVAYILSYGRRLEFYETLKLLFKQVAIQRLLVLASERPKTEKMHVELPIGESAHVLRTPPQPLYAEPDERYDELHALVKNGELKKAFSVYSRITKERVEKIGMKAERKVPEMPEKRKKMKHKRRTLLDQEYQEKLDTKYDKLHMLVKEGDFHTAKRLLKSLKE